MGPRRLPGFEPKGFESCMPCVGGEAFKPANEDRLNNIAARVSTTIFKNLSHVEKLPEWPIKPGLSRVSSRS